MKTSQAEKFRRKWVPLIAQACLSNKLPDDACVWPILEVVKTTILRGSGESTSWHPHKTIRLNGIQIWKGTPYDFEAHKPLSEFDLLPVGTFNNSQLYVIKPGVTPQ